MLLKSEEITQEHGICTMSKTTNKKKKKKKRKKKRETTKD